MAELDHVNVKCLLDGRKFRISARSGEVSRNQLGDLTVSALHRRLADQTGADELSFTLYLAGGGGLQEGRRVAADEILRDLAHWSHTKHHFTVLFEMRPWTSLVPPPSLDSPAATSTRRRHMPPPPPPPPPALPDLPRPATEPKSHFTVNSEALQALQYQLEIAESLLAEDRDQWRNDLDVLEQRLSKQMHPMDSISAEELAIESANARLRDEIYELNTAAEERNVASRTLQRDREQARAEVDKSADQIDHWRVVMLDSLAQCGAADEKDLDVIERLVTLVSQKFMISSEATAVEAELASAMSTLDKTKYQRRTLHNSVEEAKGNIRVVVRLRPTLPMDLMAPHHPVRDEEGALLIDESANTIRLASPVTGTHDYEFFKVYGPDDQHPAARQQRLIFLEQVQPLLQSLFDGQNVSVLAYGQTGSGKTHTIFGGGSDSAAGSSSTPNELDGLLPQSVDHLFELRDRFIQSRNQASVSFVLSMVEVYMNDVFDVLSPAATLEQPQWGAPGRSSKPATVLPKCEVKAVSSEGATVVGATEVHCETREAAFAALERGFASRTTHKTLTNPRSSRSHLLMTLKLQLSSDNERVTSQLMFADLAGSERVHRSLSEGDRLKEAQHINRSLSALGDVLSALTTGSSHVPYRNSRLTHLLQRCIGGSGRAVLVACICPHVKQRHNLGETATTLSFAARARLVRNKVADRD